MNKQPARESVRPPKAVLQTAAAETMQGYVDCQLAHFGKLLPVVANS